MSGGNSVAVVIVVFSWVISQGLDMRAQTTASDMTNPKQVALQAWKQRYKKLNGERERLDACIQALDQRVIDCFFDSRQNPITDRADMLDVFDGSIAVRGLADGTATGFVDFDRQAPSTQPTTRTIASNWYLAVRDQRLASRFRFRSLGTN